MREELFERAKQLRHEIKVLQGAVDMLKARDARPWSTVRIFYEDGYDHYVEGMDKLLEEMHDEMLRRVQKKLAETQKQFEELK